MEVETLKKAGSHDAETLHPLILDGSSSLLHSLRLRKKRYLEAWA